MIYITSWHRHHFHRHHLRHHRQHRHRSRIQHNHRFYKTDTLYMDSGTMWQHQYLISASVDFQTHRTGHMDWTT